MCGIFGFALRSPIEVNEAIALLEILEEDKKEDERHPVGGYGAGLAFLASNGNFSLIKVGKTTNSPSRELYKWIDDEPTRVLIAHVRFPSPKFMYTSRFKEAAQPYHTQCLSRDLTIISAHNGNVINYERLKQTLKPNHVLESEKVGFIDSEVIPHLFEELVLKISTTEKAMESLFSALEGNNTVAVLQLINKVEKGFLHLIHKGKTRGLTVWTNSLGEVIFCSRKTVVNKTSFKTLISKGSFQEIFYVDNKETRFWKRSFRLQPFIKSKEEV
jgi:glucosamine 6-phosphate synthetase-like amidotransferase/phosphosugar isomerase protein